MATCSLHAVASNQGYNTSITRLGNTTLHGDVAMFSIQKIGRDAT